MSKYSYTPEMDDFIREQFLLGRKDYEIAYGFLTRFNLKRSVVAINARRRKLGLAFQKRAYQGLL